MKKRDLALVVDDDARHDPAAGSVDLVTIDLFHRTDAQAAAEIIAAGTMVSKENTREAYFSNRRDGQTDGYGDTVIHIRVPAAWAELDDEFPDGEQHFRVLCSRLLPEHFIND